MERYEDCILQAEEAEKLAALVSYNPDRERMLVIAAMWRERARRALQPKLPKHKTRR